MTRPLVAVVLATYQRAHLLARSLDCYQRQEFDNDRFELVVVDDHSTDGTVDLVKQWGRETGIRYQIVTVGPKTAAWRDCGAVINAGIRATTADYILLTHPEVMPGRKSVAACVAALGGFEGSYQPRWHERPVGLYACCKVYYMGRVDQDFIDSVPWNAEGPLAVRQIAGFYDDQPGHPHYSHKMTDAIGVDPAIPFNVWESWVFGGCSRETWKRLGGMLETQQWGSVDVAFMARRKALGIRNHTCLDPQTLVVHQNHDGPTEVPTPRVEENWKAELAQVNLQDPAMLRYPAIDNLGWG